MNTNSSFAGWAKGFRQASGLLIKRGTALGPLLPTLTLTPLFIVSAWLFQATPGLAVMFAVASLAPVVAYIVHYSRFATKSPDLLQSEEYRYEMQKMHLIAAKELPFPMPVSELSLPNPTSNPAQEFPPIEDVTKRIDDLTRGSGK